MQKILTSTVIAAGLVLGFQNCGTSFSSDLDLSSNADFGLPGTLLTPTPSPIGSPISIIPTPTPTPTPPGATPFGKITLHQADVGNGLMRFTATVKIGSSPAFEAIVDTGSVGLRVMPGVLSASDYTNTGVVTSEVLGGTRVLKGGIALATVSVGGITSPTSFPISVITSATCAAAAPNCNPGLPGGLVGLLGIGMRSSQSQNPMIGLGARQWIVSAGQVGAAGEIDLFNSPIDASAYFTIQMAPETTAKAGVTPLWDDKDLSGCIVNNDNLDSTCGSTILDTGGNANFHLSGGASGAAWADGTHATFSLKNAAGQSFDLPFIIGAQPGMDVTLPTGTSQASGSNPLNSGQLPFFQNSILYDPVQGTIGLKPNK